MPFMLAKELTPGWRTDPHCTSDHAAFVVRASASPKI